MKNDINFNWDQDVVKKTDTDYKVNTCQIKPKGKSKIDNPQQLATLATQDTG